MRAIHPGEVLRDEFLTPLEMSANALAMASHVLAPSSTTSFENNGR
jgi:plasmid maintenance system antidote protein VapI